jgi:phage repressor protein C with HTH and peptisase S24 domain
MEMMVLAGSMPLQCDKRTKQSSHEVRLSQFRNAAISGEDHAMVRIDAAWIRDRLGAGRGAQARLAEAIGMNPNHLAKVMQGVRRVSADEALAMVDYFDGAGRSERLPEVPDLPTPAHADVLVPVFNVFASAGGGTMVGAEEVVDRLAFPRDYLRHITKSHPRHLAIIGVKGDSMIPTLKDDDVVMIDMSKVDPSFDGLFVLKDGGDALLVKRIGRASRQDYVMIISDNPLVPAVEWHKSEVKLVGKVIWRGVKE